MFENSSFMLIVVLAGILVIGMLSGDEKKPNPLTNEMIHQAEQLLGLTFTDTERDSMRDGLNDNLKSYRTLREVAESDPLENATPPAILFNPLPAGFTLPSGASSFKMSKTEVKMPADIEDLAFYSLRDLAELIRTRKLSSMELTRMYLQRLKKHDAQLQCVVTVTEDLALKQAARADAEIAAGKYRGPLHGIPYGAKDLLAVKGFPTTWGSAAHKNQTIDLDATVVKRLEDAGAVLVAKLTLGALAWGDVWFGGKTRNPWNLEQGSSGSSAGSASATSAGLVAFAIGSETWGSIVSPSTRCGVSGLRPTYGRVSRYGAMALSWSMDKLGPICRTVEDCAIVFNAIYGPDENDQTLYDVPFNFNADMDIRKLRVGYLKSAFENNEYNKANDEQVLAVLKGMGLQLTAIELPKMPTFAMGFVLSAEAAAAFDQLTRSNQDDMLVRQIKNAWPNVFRASRFIPAVEYINANRERYRSIQKFHKMMENIDLYVAPSFGESLLLTNLTGHPCVVVPNGFNDKGSPTSISFTGRLFEEGKLLALSAAYQNATDFHRKHPKNFQ